MTRRRIPADEKRAKGTHRPDREARTPPAKVSGTPRAPRGLKGPALEHWKYMTDLLSRRHQLTLDSAPSLERLCRVYAECVELGTILERDGRVQHVKSTAGDTVPKAHPMLRAYQDADRRYRGWLAEFGLTDATRGKVNALPIRPELPGETPADPGYVPGSRYGLS